MPLKFQLANRYETVQLVRVDVDLDAPENANPRQELEGSEFITVLRVPKKNLRKQLDALAGRHASIQFALSRLSRASRASHHRWLTVQVQATAAYIIEAAFFSFLFFF